MTIVKTINKVATSSVYCLALVGLAGVACSNETTVMPESIETTRSPKADGIVDEEHVVGLYKCTDADNAFGLHIEITDDDFHYSRGYLLTLDHFGPGEHGWNFFGRVEVVDVVEVGDGTQEHELDVDLFVGEHVSTLRFQLREDASSVDGTLSGTATWSGDNPVFSSRLETDHAWTNCSYEPRTTP